MVAGFKEHPVLQVYSRHVITRDMMEMFGGLWNIG